VLRAKKRLALFLDGTWVAENDDTNVWRLRTLFAPKCADGREQRAYYSAGLGTKFGERIRGGMFGHGIDAAIASAYEWLIENYELGDDIFIFGFSRGAYTARSLSGFVSKCGLLQRGSPLGINQLYDRYRRQHARTIRELIAETDKDKVSFDFEEQWVMEFARPIEIKFIGVFDTVGALGVPFPILRRIKGPAYPFLNTGLRHTNEYAFHAMAIDEHRKAFRQTLWTDQGALGATRPTDRTEQRWFIGAHANVGGGCFSDPLAQLPFAWLGRKAAALGLTFQTNFSTPTVAATSAISNSFAEFAWGLYRLFKLGIPYHRKIDVPPKEEGPGVKTFNETIDSSVLQSMAHQQEL
jgi:uncharacterized protein (DUF2235 family)